MGIAATNAYRTYLAISAAEKRLAAAGAEPGSIYYTSQTVGADTSATYWRTRVDAAIAKGEVPQLYRSGELSVAIKGVTDWSISDEDEREQAAQLVREEIIRNLTRLYPDTVIARYNGKTYAYFEPLENFGVSIDIGRALCERVLLREEVDEVPDPELLAEVPTVKKVRAVYGWRCNDAELVTA